MKGISALPSNVKKSSSVVVVVVVIIVVVISFFDVAEGNKVCTIKELGQLEKSPMKLKCRGNSLISNVTVMGYAKNDICQGLTPELFVQMNSCFWKSSCTLKYSTKRPNYMLKLYRGTMAECVTHAPERLVYSYECTKSKVGQLHVVRRKGRTREGGKEGAEDGRRKEVREKEGMMVSHDDHPWLYHRHPDPFSAPERDQLVLEPPIKKLKALKYTIRTLNLMHGDHLIVNWTADDKTWINRTFSAEDRLTSMADRNHVTTKATRVVFSLDAALHTNGGEGFVICFKWEKKARKVSDVCKRLVKTMKCKKGGSGKKEGKGKQRGEGKKGKRGKERTNKGKKGEKNKANNKGANDAGDNP